MKLISWKTPFYLRKSGVYGGINYFYYLSAVYYMYKRSTLCQNLVRLVYTVCPSCVYHCSNKHKNKYKFNVLYDRIKPEIRDVQCKNRWSFNSTCTLNRAFDDQAAHPVTREWIPLLVFQAIWDNERKVLGIPLRLLQHTKCLWKVGLILKKDICR